MRAESSSQPTIAAQSVMGELAGELVGHCVKWRRMTVELARVEVGFREVEYVRVGITHFLKIRVSAVRFRP